MSGTTVDPGDGPELLTAREQLAALRPSRLFPWGQLPDVKQTKLPLTTSGRKGSSTNDKLWTSLDLAEAAARVGLQVGGQVSLPGLALR